MESIMQITAIAVAAALCSVAVKRQAPEIGMVLGLSAGVLILLMSIPAIKSVKDLMVSLSETADLAPAVLTPVIKIVGIAIITKIAAELCRDVKEGGIAAFLETAGAALALVVCIPLIEAVLSMLGELL